METGMRSNEGGNCRSDLSDFNLKNCAQMEAHIAMNAQAARANFDKYYKARLLDVSALYKEIKRRLDVVTPLEGPVLIIDVGPNNFDFTQLQAMFDAKVAQLWQARVERRQSLEADAKLPARSRRLSKAEVYVNVDPRANQDDPMKLKLMNVDYSNIQKVVSSLKGSTTIRRLDLSSGNLDASDAEHIAELLTTNTSITDLDLSGNNLATEGLEKLADSLTRDTTKLVSLDLGANNLGQRAAKTLSAIFESPHCKLQRVQLAANLLGIYGAEALVPGLQVNKSVRTIGLQYNALGNDGITHLKEVFMGGKEGEEKDANKQNKTLVQMSLESNKATMELTDEVAKFCKKNEPGQERRHLVSLEEEERWAREEEVATERQMLKAFADKAREDILERERQKLVKAELGRIAAALEVVEASETDGRDKLTRIEEKEFLGIMSRFYPENHWLTVAKKKKASTPLLVVAPPSTRPSTTGKKTVAARKLSVPAPKTHAPKNMAVSKLHLAKMNGKPPVSSTASKDLPAPSSGGISSLTGSLPSILRRKSLPSPRRI